MSSLSAIFHPYHTTRLIEGGKACTDITNWPMKLGLGRHLETLILEKGISAWIHVSSFFFLVNSSNVWSTWLDKQVSGVGLWSNVKQNWPLNHENPFLCIMLLTFIYELMYWFWKWLNMFLNDKIKREI